MGLGGLWEDLADRQGLNPLGLGSHRSGAGRETPYMKRSDLTTLLRTATWTTMALTLLNPRRREWEASPQEVEAIYGLRLLFGSFKSFCGREFPDVWRSQWKLWGQEDERPIPVQFERFVAYKKLVAKFERHGRIRKAPPLAFDGLQAIVTHCKQELTELWNGIEEEESLITGKSLQDSEVTNLVRRVRRVARRAFRDAARLSLGFIGLLRPGELGALRSHDVYQIRKYPMLVAHLGLAKSSGKSRYFPGVQTVTLPVPHRGSNTPAAELFWSYAVRTRLHQKEALEDPGTVRRLFPRVTVNGSEVTRPPKAVAHELAEVLRTRTLQVRAKGGSVRYLSYDFQGGAITGYSLRRGLTNFLLDSKLSGPAMQRLGRWSSNTMQGYYMLSSLGALQTLQRVLCPEEERVAGETHPECPFGPSGGLRHRLRPR